MRAGLGNIIGFVDTPVISSLNLRKELSRRGAFEFDLKEMQN